MRIKQFTKPAFLKQIGRDLLARFLGQFEQRMGSGKIPGSELSDEAYFEEVSRLATSQEGLPDELNEAMHDIAVMATEEGQERLERTIARQGIQLTFQETSTCADVAVQTWLATPEVFSMAHQEQQFTRVSSFDYYGGESSLSRPEGVLPPDQARLSLIESDLDAWFKEHNRGDRTSRLELHRIDGEFWFLIRHGDPFTRVITAEADRATRVRHFRPAKDDVVVYSPERDEIRIHARTLGEKDLYRAVFGRRLLGDDRHFSRRKTYTLHPIVTDGSEALVTEPHTGIAKIVLREIEWALNDEHSQVYIAKATDLFAVWSTSNDGRCPIPPAAYVVRAAFEVHFEGADKPRKVHVRKPNTLKLSRHCDASLVHRWLSERGFRESLTESPHGKLVANA